MSPGPAFPLVASHADAPSDPNRCSAGLRADVYTGGPGSRSPTHDGQIVPGQQLTIFRAALGNPQDSVTKFGEGVAVLVDSRPATVQLSRTHEPMRSGALAAVHH